MKKIILIADILLMGLVLQAKNKLTLGAGFYENNITNFYRGKTVVAAMPIIDARYDKYFINGINIGMDLYDTDALTFSLFVNPFDGNRIKSKNMDREYKSINNRKYQVAGGAIVGYDFNFYDTKALLSVSGGERGVKGNLKVIKPFGVTERLYLIPAAGANFYSKDYTDYYWGIGENELGGKINNTYDPNSSYSASMDLAARFYFTEKLVLQAFMSVEKFSSEVGNSPIIDNSILMKTGAGVQYSF